MPNTYTYGTLTSPHHIRLVELLPGEQSTPISALIHEVRLPDDADFDIAVPVYTALSYMWGPDANDKIAIWLDGEKFMVRPNLFAALQTLRHASESTTLWIDAICIHQDDVYERNCQVARMGRIYHAARSVKIWLGLMDANSKQAMEYAQELRLKRDASVIADHSDNTAPIAAIDALLRKDYWTRAWIIQEVILAAKIDIHCGELAVQWEDLVEACLYVRQHLSDGPAMHLIDQRTSLLRGERSLLAWTLESLIRTHHLAACSERQDRVYALLSLASDCASGQGLKPDYRTPRLTLMVQVLQFCRPTDPVEFISMLFVALAHERQDTAWDKAVLCWNNSVRNMPALSSWPGLGGSSWNQAQLVQITHFVTVSSPTKNSARFHSFAAVLDPEHIRRCMRGDDSEIVRMVNNGADGTKSFDYHDRVCGLKDSQVGVLLHANNYVVFSTSRIAAAASPCAGLGLHDGAEICSSAHCAVQSQCRSDD